MGGFEEFLQFIREHVRINLRGGDVSVTEERLHTAEVCSAL